MAERGDLPRLAAFQCPNDSPNANLWTKALQDLTRTEQDYIRSHLHEPSDPKQLLL